MDMSFFLIPPQVLLAVCHATHSSQRIVSKSTTPIEACHTFCVLNPPSSVNFAMSISGGPDLRHCQAIFMTVSSRSVKVGISFFAGEGSAAPFSEVVIGVAAPEDILRVL